MAPRQGGHAGVEGPRKGVGGVHGAGEGALGGWALAGRLPEGKLPGLGGLLQAVLVGRAWRLCQAGRIECQAVSKAL